MTIMADERDYCFGQSQSTMGGLIFGIIIIIAGLIQLFGDRVSWLQWDNIWPFFIIIIGLLIVGNTFYKR
jgi:uncharacterized integral membrane protein